MSAARSMAPRVAVYSTTPLHADLRARFDRAAERSMSALASALGVSVTIVESLMYGGKAKPETAARTQAAFVVYLQARGSL